MKHLLLCVFAFSLLFSACKKEEIEVPPIPDVTESITVSEQGSNDETARNEYDQSIESAFKALETTNFGSRSADSGVILPCGIIKVDTTGGKHKIVYGSNCGRKVLSGRIVATLMPSTAKWQDVGAVIKLDYQNYTVLFEVNNQTLVFNGSILVTNVNGGLIYETITKQTTIEHKIRGNLNITFDNGKTRSWQVFKRRTYSAANGQIENLEAQIAADSSGNIAEVGITKAGENFITTIPSAFIYKNCSKGQAIDTFVLVDGKLVFTVNSNSLTAEAGYTLENETITPINNCSSIGYNLSWSIGGISKVEFQYY